MKTILKGIGEGLVAFSLVMVLVMFGSMSDAGAATSPVKKVTRSAPSKTPHGVPLQANGRVKFSGTAAKTISLPGIVKKAKDDGKYNKTSAGFEQDIVGCYVAYPGASKASKAKLSDCVNYTIKFHKMYR